MCLFFIMSPFFFFFGFFMFLCCLFLNLLNVSLYLSWTFFICSFYVNFPLYFDFCSCLFISMVLIISGSIVLYSEYYMESEIYKFRFFFLMLMFVISMLFLILSPSLFCMLLGWDGLGLVSYVLVIYYQSSSAFCSGMLTALSNRVGDVFILCSLVMFFSFGGWSYMNFLTKYNLFFLILFFCIASMTKSAQVPFSAWLPAAMAAPTPVSSLVHSSTLVTAGVYIMIRFFYFFNDIILFFFFIVSLLTMIMAGITGVFENDLKKIIALSTLSQLGLMMMTISLGLLNLAFFHLITHACFKALLFMCAGLFIHSFFDNQDIRSFGLMSKDFSLILSMFNVGNLSLCGFPFLSGFFSKDLILEKMMLMNMNFLFLIMFMVGTFLTVFYSFRLFFYLTFKSSFFFSTSVSIQKVSVHWSMTILLFFSIVLGMIFSNLFIFPMNYIILPLMMKMFVLMMCLLSSIMCFFFCFISYKYKTGWMIYFLHSMWFLGFLKTDFFTQKILNMSWKLAKIDMSVLEFFLGFKNMFYISNISLHLSHILNNHSMMMFMYFGFVLSLYMILM